MGFLLPLMQGGSHVSHFLLLLLQSHNPLQNLIEKVLEPTKIDLGWVGTGTVALWGDRKATFHSVLRIYVPILCDCIPYLCPLYYFVS